MWQVRRKWVKYVASGSSASQVGQVRRKCVKCVASGSSASQVGQVCCKSKGVEWVKCVASGASGSNRLIIPTPEQVCQVCQRTRNQLLVPVCTRTVLLGGGRFYSERGILPSSLASARVLGAEIRKFGVFQLTLLGWPA